MCLCVVWGVGEWFVKKKKNCEKIVINMFYNDNMSNNASIERVSKISDPACKAFAAKLDLQTKFDTSNFTKQHHFMSTLW